MKIELVDLKAQFATIKSEITQGVLDVVESQHFIGGPHNASFEKNFARVCGVEHCIGVSNGTDAITLILQSLGVGRGDEVVLPTNTFIASAEPVVQLGAKPVFVDCHPDTYLMDLGKVEAALTSRTKAIIPVHLYGQMVEMDRLTEIAKARGIHILEDSAQAHMAKYKGKGPGQWGVAATFSFYPGKNLGAYGDAGAIVTGDAALAKKVRMLANHGRVSKYDHELVGYNNRLDSLQAKVLDIKLKHLESWTAARRKHASQYDRLLAGKSNVTRPTVQEAAFHVYHLYVLRSKQREKIFLRLKENGVEAGIHYPIPLHLLKAFKDLGYKKGDFPNAEQAAEEIFSLPMFPELTQTQIEYVCGLI